MTDTDIIDLETNRSESSARSGLDHQLKRNIPILNINRRQGDYKLDSRWISGLENFVKGFERLPGQLFPRQNTRVDFHVVHNYANT
jgi:hypothetical protein